MRICIVGKYPPIEGGVSSRTFHIAEGLARLGHRVDVVTNAKEVEPAFRMFMRDDDFRYVEHVDASGGEVRVHWTTSSPLHMHVPIHNPFATKLATVAAEVVESARSDVIFSFYLEPYGVAGHLAAEMTGAPHIVKSAGSDTGRLWAQPQLGGLYNHVFRKAAGILAGGAFSRRLREIGVPAERLFDVPHAFVDPGALSPIGPTLQETEIEDLAAAAGWDAEPVLRRWRAGALVLGTYGKIGPKKGALELLAALPEVVAQGHDVVLLALVQGKSELDQRYVGAIRELGLADRVLRLPFIPPWRIPVFLRTCHALCSLEQDFPIRGHLPIVAYEIMAAGRCAVLSREIAEKHPAARRLTHGHNCLIVEDATNAKEIAAQISTLAAGRSLATSIGAAARGAIAGAPSVDDFLAAFLRGVEQVLSRS
jgi:glycosyltransferase involved in cell wall biosynthesis